MDPASASGRTLRYNTNGSPEYVTRDGFLTAPSMRRTMSSSTGSCSPGSETSFQEEYDDPAFSSATHSPVFGGDMYLPASESLQRPTYAIPSYRPTSLQTDIPEQVGEVCEEDLPAFDPLEGDKRLQWQMYYNYNVDSQKAFWTLRKGYTPSDKYPQERPDEKAFNENGKQIFPCRHPDCKAVPFARCWDLKRHFKKHGPSKEGEKLHCDYKVCPSSRNQTPFDRKDHCREHYRDVHMEDLTKRNAEEKVEEWLEGRQTHKDWWRCNKCLKRVKIRKYQYMCDTCNTACDSKRVAARKKKAEMQEQENIRIQVEPLPTRYRTTSMPNSQTPRIQVPEAYPRSQKHRGGNTSIGSQSVAYLPHYREEEFDDGEEGYQFAFEEEMENEYDPGMPMTQHYTYAPSEISWAQHSTMPRGGSHTTGSTW